MIKYVVHSGFLKFIANNRWVAAVLFSREKGIRLLSTKFYLLQNFYACK